MFLFTVSGFIDGNIAASILTLCHEEVFYNTGFLATMDSLCLNPDWFIRVDGFS